MRFDWLAAAAAMMFAAPASAETITQTFSSSFVQNGSIGPVRIGGLGLAPNQAVTSATIFYDASLYLSSGYALPFGATGVATITYSGTVGFATSGLPDPLSASNAFSGSQVCSPGICTLSFDLAGSLLISSADLATLGGNSYVQIAPSTTLNYSVRYNGTPTLLTQQNRGSFVSGRIVYDVSAVPEPAAWAMMIFGMGAIGGTLRHRRRVSAYA